MNDKPKLPLKERLWRVIFLSDTAAGKTFDVILLVSIGVSVLVVMLESMQGMRESYGSELRGAEYFFTILFTIEYITRIVIARRPLKYIFSFFGIVDLLSILPTYIHILIPEWESQHLAVIRVLRILRMFRVLKMARHMGAARVLVNALRASRPKITVFLFGVLTVVTISGTFLYLVEGPTNEGFSSIPKSIYWAIVTITTVGYGDITPHTAAGQFLSAIMMIIGYGILAVPAGIVGVEIWSEISLDDRECNSCGSGGHLTSAQYCRDCGEKLPPDGNRDHHERRLE